VIVTEEEAKKMFCPIVGGKCVASECMGWEQDYDFILGSDSEYPFVPKAEKTPNGKGYCRVIKK